jgi:hypothetical protein
MSRDHAQTVYHGREAELLWLVRCHGSMFEDTEIDLVLETLFWCSLEFMSDLISNRLEITVIKI